MVAALVVAVLALSRASTTTVDAAPMSQQAVLTASPGGGTVGATLTVSGSGFPSGSDVAFTWDGSQGENSRQRPTTGRSDGPEPTAWIIFA
jgi:hypothetical protein